MQLSDDTKRQAQLMLLGQPHASPEERLIAKDARGVAWMLTQRAMQQRLIIDELRYESAGWPDWLKRWVG